MDIFRYYQEFAGFCCSIWYTAEVEKLLDSGRSSRGFWQLMWWMRRWGLLILFVGMTVCGLLTVWSPLERSFSARICYLYRFPAKSRSGARLFSTGRLIEFEVNLEIFSMLSGCQIKLLPWASESIFAGLATIYETQNMFWQCLPLRHNKIQVQRYWNDIKKTLEDYSLTCD